MQAVSHSSDLASDACGGPRTALIAAGGTRGARAARGRFAGCGADAAIAADSVCGGVGRFCQVFSGRAVGQCIALRGSRHRRKLAARHGVGLVLAICAVRLALLILVLARRTFSTAEPTFLRLEVPRL